MQKYGKTFCKCDSGYEGITCEKQVLPSTDPCDGFMCNNGTFFFKSILISWFSMDEKTWIVLKLWKKYY